MQQPILENEAKAAEWGTPNQEAASEPPTIEVDLGSIWHDLVNGKYFVAATLCSSSRCFVSLQVRRAPPRPPSRESFDILERILLGESQKSVAQSLGRAVSTISAKASDCLRYLGREQRSSRVSAVLAMAVHAANGRAKISARINTDDSTGLLCTVSVQRPDLWLQGALSPAVIAVTQMLVEGKSRAEMASLRGTSARTIANQLAGVFCHLRVSGRSELLSMLIRNPARSHQPGHVARRQLIHVVH